MPSPVNKEEMNVEVDPKEVLSGEYIETTRNTPAATNVKEEEYQETKNV